MDLNPQDHQTVRNVAREHEPDRYIAALIAPRAVRDDLIALAAFAGEVSRIAKDVRDPLAGEIRLQWWRDTLKAGAEGARSGSPVADAFCETIARHGLSLQAIDDLLDAHAHTLYPAPPVDDDALRLEIDLKEGTLLRLAAHIVGAREDALSEDLIADATQAYGLTRVACDLPYALARGRVPLSEMRAPRDITAKNAWQPALAWIIAEAREHLSRAKRAFSVARIPVKSALLPLALVEPYLKALEVSSRDPARDIADIAPLTRMWRLYRAHISGRI